MARNALVWFRTDLRLADNPALAAALKLDGAVHAVYVHEEVPELRVPGAAGQWWLHASLDALAHDLAGLGVSFEVLRGDPVTLLLAALHRHKADALFFNRRYAPPERRVDEAVVAALTDVSVEQFNAVLLVEPWELTTGSGKPYSVYTPFYRALRKFDVPRPGPVPASTRPAVKPKPVHTDYREPFWAKKFTPHWKIGEAAARDVLHRFLDERLARYQAGRDEPAEALTSELSPHLRHGEIGPRQVWHAAVTYADRHHEAAEVVDKFLRELSWRDFNYCQLYYHDDIVEHSIKPGYQGVKPRTAPDELHAWQRGQTGLPMVDAGMRQMWELGWMHNRVRLLTASFLAKNLLLDWRLGEKWFWDCLVDGDPANNPGNWQWVAGSGVDASPFFRIFNPVTQGEKFDPQGDYIRRFVPELAKLPAKWIHRPYEAPADVLAQAGVTLGKTYPKPLVDLTESRERALAALRRR